MSSHRRWEDFLDQRLQDPARAVGYLNACLEDDDPETFRLALRDVVHAFGGIARLAENPSIDREALERVLAANGDPDLRDLEAILHALGFRLSITFEEAG